MNNRSVCRPVILTQGEVRGVFKTLNLDLRQYAKLLHVYTY